MVDLYPMLLDEATSADIKIQGKLGTICPFEHDIESCDLTLTGELVCYDCKAVTNLT